MFCCSAEMEWEVRRPKAKEIFQLPMHYLQTTRPGTYSFSGFAPVGKNGSM
jgi:hypothetical protein